MSLEQRGGARLGARIVGTRARSRLPSDRRGSSLRAAGLLRAFQAGGGRHRPLIHGQMRDGDRVDPRSLGGVAGGTRASLPSREAARRAGLRCITISMCATLPAACRLAVERPLHGTHTIHVGSGESLRRRAVEFAAAAVAAVDRRQGAGFAGRPRGGIDRKGEAAAGLGAEAFVARLVGVGSCSLLCV